MRIEIKRNNTLPEVLLEGAWAVVQPTRINGQIYAISFQSDGTIKSSISAMKHTYTTDGETLTAVLNDGKVTYTGKFNPLTMRISGTAVWQEGKRSWPFDFEKMSWLDPQTDPRLGGIFSITRLNDQNTITALRPYRPYRSYGVINPDFDGYSSMVLNLKNIHDSAIQYFYNRLNPIIFGQDLVICYVPSSDPAKTNTGIRRLATRLAAQNGRTNATECLVRTKKIDKLATGGNRDIQVHLDSIKVDRAELIKNKTVLLLDDVTTSHNSLLAGKQLLLAAGAKNVYCLALAQT